MTDIAAGLRTWAQDLAVDLAIAASLLDAQQIRLDRWEKATGGLSPALVAKALTFAAEQWYDRELREPDDLDAILHVTFEVPT